MRHISKNRYGAELPSACSVKIDKTSKFHPLSYYLNGGVDLTGESLDNSAEVEYDNEEELNELLEEGAMSVPYGDPKMSKFRLVEMYSNHEAMSSKSAKLTTEATGAEIE